MKLGNSLILFAHLSVLFSCIDTDQVKKYSGITETRIDSLDQYGNPVGTIISIDENDWKYDTIPEIQLDPTITYPPSTNQIGPVFPNPATETTYLEITWSSKNYIYIYIKDTLDEIVKTLYADTLEPGYYLCNSISWNLRDDDGKKLPKGIYRCFYEWQFFSRIDSVYHQAIGYGDIRIE